MNKKLLALGRLKAGERNKTEAEYEAYLELRKKAGEIIQFEFEGIKLRLASNVYYKPDFYVMNANCEIEIHEVKSIWLGDALTKIRVASSKFPFRFFAVYKKTKKDGGGWRIEEIV